jgi:hypothetical protein
MRIHLQCHDAIEMVGPFALADSHPCDNHGAINVARLPSGAKQVAAAASFVSS